jgi:hypothetical protein
MKVDQTEEMDREMLATCLLFWLVMLAAEITEVVSSGVIKVTQLTDYGRK